MFSVLQSYNKEHVKLLNDMGITIAMLSDGRMQLVHNYVTVSVYSWNLIYFILKKKIPVLSSNLLNNELMGSWCILWREHFQSWMGVSDEKYSLQHFVVYTLYPLDWKFDFRTFFSWIDILFRGSSEVLLQFYLMKYFCFWVW